MSEELWHKVKRYRNLPPEEEVKSDSFLPYATAREYGRALSLSGLTLEQGLSLLANSDGDKDEAEFTIGFLRRE